MRLYIEPGSEYLLPFAKHKLRWMKEWEPDLINKVIHVDTGELIFIQPGIEGLADQIRIHAKKADFGWGKDVVDGGTEVGTTTPKIQRKAYVGSRSNNTVHPFKWAGLEHAAVGLTGQAPPGWSHLQTGYKNNSEVLGWAQTSGSSPSRLWWGLLSSYEVGGEAEFSIPATYGNVQTTLPGAALSPDQKTLVTYARLGGTTDFILVRNQLASTKSPDGTVSLNATPTVIGQPTVGAGTLDVDTVIADGDLKNVGWGERTVTDLFDPNGGLSTRTLVARAVNLSVADGTQTSFPDVTFTGVSGFTIVNHFSVFDQQAITVVPSGVGQPWSVVFTSRWLDAGGGPGMMWGFSELYRGGTRVLGMGDPADGSLTIPSSFPTFSTIRLGDYCTGNGGETFAFRYQKYSTIPEG